MAGSLQAQTSASSAGKKSVTVDFEITMKDLALAAKTQNDRAIPTNRALILDGDIGTITVHEDSDTSFVAEVELLNGIWVNEEQVELYRTYILCEGPQFRSFFSSKSPVKLKGGQTIIVLATYEGLGVDYDGKTPVSVVKAIDIRKLF
jgi:hypothetical protein